ncbi:hypothetical protein TNCV_2183741 [Trichonephila clavipes]|nr:hypothetical protein TNCV_2183741 [Trichonephila clavipes]
MFSTDHEEYRNLIHFLESDKEFEFYILKCQKDKPIKAVIKGLPNSSKINDITNDLKSLSITKYMISLLKAHCHPPINDRSIANASCTTIGPPLLKSRPSLQAQVSKTKKIRVPDRG